MASDTDTILSKCDGVASLEGLSEPAKKEKSYELHKAAFYGDHERVVELLTVAMEDPSQQDVHGGAWYSVYIASPCLWYPTSVSAPLCREHPAAHCCDAGSQR